MYPNPSSGVVHGSEHLRLFEFLGRILGKALYEGITVSAHGRGLLFALRLPAPSPTLFLYLAVQAVVPFTPGFLRDATGKQRAKNSKRTRRFDVTFAFQVQPEFATFFLGFMRGDYNFLHLFHDLHGLDPELYRNLMFLKTYDGGDVEDLCLTFSVADEEFGANKEASVFLERLFENRGRRGAEVCIFVWCCGAAFVARRVAP